MWFEYGRTTAYGQRTPPVQIAAGITNQPVSAQLSGLVAGRALPLPHRRDVVRRDRDGNRQELRHARARSSNGHRCTIVGTQGPDVITGTPGNDVICGLGGNDVIRGGGGNDIILGGPGNDIIYGGPGNDTHDRRQRERRAARQRRATTASRAAPGNDTLLGGPGRDTLLGGPGADQLYSVDNSVDIVDGGPGTDTATVDKHDRVVRVEHKKR